jgi:hypothetical protein
VPKNWGWVIAGEGHRIRPDLHDALPLIEADAAMRLRLRGETDHSQKQRNREFYLRRFSPASSL